MPAPGRTVGPAVHEIDVVFLMTPDAPDVEVLLAELVSRPRVAQAGKLPGRRAGPVPSRDGAMVGRLLRSPSARTARCGRSASKRPLRWRRRRSVGRDFGAGAPGDAAGESGLRSGWRNTGLVNRDFTLTNEEVISLPVDARLRLEFPNDSMMRVSHETIYKSLFVQGRGELRRELSRCLRSGRAQRRKRGRIETVGVSQEW